MPDAKQCWIITSVGLMVFLINADITITNLALTNIAQHFSTQLSTIGWIINSYMVTVSLFILAGGYFGDKFGHKRVFLVGCLIFILGSMISGFATTSEMLIFGRIIQGFSVALVFPQILAISSLSFPMKKKGFIMGILISIAGLSQAIGPALGGYLLQKFDWRAVFLLNLPIASLAGLISLWQMHDTCNSERQPINYFIVTILSLTLLSLLLLLNKLHNWRNSPYEDLIYLTISIGLILVLIFSDSRSKNPLIFIKEFANRNFIIAIILRALFIYNFASILFLMGLFLQNVLKYNPIQAGMLLLTFTLSFGIISPLAGKLADCYGERLSLAVGMAFLTIGNYLFIQIDIYSRNIDLIMPLFLAGIGFGLALPANTSIALKSASDKRAGLASGIFYTTSFFSWTIGVVFSSLILVKSGTQYFYRLAKEHNVQLSLLQQKPISHIYLGLHSHLSSFNINTIVTSLTQEAFIHGLTTAMWACTILALISVIISLLLKSNHPQQYKSTW